MRKYKFYLNDEDRLLVTPTDVDPGDDLLSLAIQKWGTIVELLEEGKWVSHDNGILTCGLCAKYHAQVDPCNGCPVRDATDWPGCVSTPYSEWEILCRTVKPTAAALHTKLLLAECELTFLKSLREEVNEIHV